ncbi:MAG: hypothetical protein FWD58_05310 [Firmicutes bacterium]|nr:hypothetical protein [Bacillota bacterium]
MYYQGSIVPDFEFFLSRSPDSIYRDGIKSKDISVDKDWIQYNYYFGDNITLCRKCYDIYIEFVKQECRSLLIEKSSHSSDEDLVRDGLVSFHVVLGKTENDWQPIGSMSMSFYEDKKKGIALMCGIGLMILK